MTKTCIGIEKLDIHLKQDHLDSDELSDNDEDIIAQLISENKDIWDHQIE